MVESVLRALAYAFGRLGEGIVFVSKFSIDEFASMRPWA
jgi:hypothetical protein